jgi:MFS family permease
MVSLNGSDRWLYRLGIMAGLVGTAHLSLNLFSGSLSLYLERERGFSVSAVGFGVGIAYVVQVAATLLVGPMVDRWGPKVALRLGPALYLIASITFIATADPLGIIGARVLQGAGIALILPAAYATIPSLAPARMRGVSLGLVGVFQSVALAVGPQLGIWLLGISASLLFTVSAVAAAVSVALSPQLRLPAVAVRSVRLFKFRRAWIPLLALTFLTLVYWGVVVAYLPIHVPASLVSAVGWFFTADAVGVLVCRIPVGFLSDRMAPSSLLRLGVIVTAASILILLAPPSLASLIVAGLGTGIGSGLLIAPTLIELQNRSEEGDRGTAMALWATSFAGGVGVGTIAAGPFVEQLGFNATLVGAAVLCLMALPIALRLRVTTKLGLARRCWQNGA